MNGVSKLLCVVLAIGLSFVVAATVAAAYNPPGQVATSCTKSSDGGAYAWVQTEGIGGPAYTEEGYAKLISYKGSGAFLHFQLLNEGGSLSYDSGAVPLTHSGQTWDSTLLQWPLIHHAWMIVYDGGSGGWGGGYPTTAWADIVESLANPVCNGPMHPLP